MSRDSKLLKKMYLLNESTFSKIKDIEDTERNFNRLDRQMRKILYGKNTSTHNKWLQYSKLLEKYMNLRKQMIAKYGEKEAIKKIEQTQQTEPISVKNIFENAPTTVDRSLFDFDNNMPEEFDDSPDVVMNSTVPANMNEINIGTQTMDDEDGDVTMKSINGSHTKQQFLTPKRKTAKEAANNLQTIYSGTVPKRTRPLVPVLWIKRNKTYTVSPNNVEQFKRFIALTDEKYPNAEKIYKNDFENYLVNGRVYNTRRDLFLSQQTARRDKNAAAMAKYRKLDEFYPKQKNRFVLQRQEGKGRAIKRKNVNSKASLKWITFR